MRVFLSHSSKDKPAVLALAEALAKHGIDPWLDTWEIAPGDDIVARINAGLEEAAAGLLVLSEHTRESRWVEAEQSYLIYARIVESKALIPVIVGDNAYVPPLLRPLARRGIEELEAIVGALLHRKGGKPPVAKPEDGKRVPARLELRRSGAAGVVAQLQLRGTAYPPLEHSRLPAALVQARDAFLRGFRSGALRTPAQAERLALERSLQELGAELGRFCLGEEAEAALLELLRGAPVGTLVELSFEADTPELLGLPFEALRLRDGRLLALEPGVLVVRRSLGLAPASHVEPLAGPLKVLVAVGAPDEEHARGVPLDQEREMQSILDATALAAQRENVEVRFLEVGHPEVIGEALRRDAYHVLHLSCHGSPGSLELETEDGEACPTTAERLLGPLRSAGRPLPLVFINACHGGVEAAQTASLAEDLLRAGVPAVVAMQTSVTDVYATELAAAFYEELARCEPPWASAALAHARRHLEQERQRQLGQGAEPPPEYATATLFLAGAEAPLVDFNRDAEPLQARPVHALAGPVPQLDLDQLIGRRKPLRQVLRALRRPEPGKVGAVLTGIGGIGKSTLAGRAMRRLAEDGWELAAHVGKIDLARLAGSVAAALFDPSQPESLQLAQALTSNELPEPLRLSLLQKLLAETRLVLVLDDFEQNLTTGGEAFRDEAAAELFRQLLGSARTGRLLVTCRHPLPGAEALLTRVSLGPMSHAEAGRLLQRLPGLAGRAPAELTRVLRVIGGHPRMLEYLDGLLRGGEARLPQVTERLAKALAEATPGGASQIEDLSEALVQTVQLGARDVLLGELLALAREQGTAELLLQVAVSNLPVAPAGAAHMLADEPSDPEPAGDAFRKLEALSLVSLNEEGEAWVHRWTAEGLAQLEGEAATRDRANRAGRYRWWRVQHETHDLGDAIEAVRNHLAGQDWDEATEIARACFEALTRFQQVTGIAALASEVLETLPVEDGDYAVIADAEAKAYLALGWTEPALRRYSQLLNLHEARAQAEPQRADYQRDLSVSYNKIGDLYRSLGQGERAQTAYQQALDIRERLAQAEPLRADYQRDLSVSYNKIGDLYRDLGQGERAQEFYLKDLAIAERLAQAEPQRADYQRDLSVSYERMGNLYRSLGQGERAQTAYQQALDIRERLAQAEPQRADYQVDLVISLVKVAHLETPPTRSFLERALTILVNLDREGRLAPADRPKLEHLQQLLE